MKIGNIKIGTDEKCFIIAEAGVNHNGDIACALEMVRKAAEAGADAVKFQTFQTDKLASKQAEKADYQKSRTDSDESQYDMLKRLELSLADYSLIIEECERENIIFMSTPFDQESVDILENMGMPAYKIPSGEITNLPLVKYIGDKKKPIILSTGMATMEEVEMAVKTISETGNNDFVLLQCTSNYPTSPEDVNLRAMNALEQHFGVPVGFSDHTLGIEISMAAVALGACVVEKHFTLDKSLPGPDHLMSLSPDELTNLVSGIRNIESAMGIEIKKPAESETNTAQVARKSICFKCDLTAGTVLKEDDLTMLRPGDGISPAKLADFIGKELTKDVKSGTKLQPDDFR